jgi:hypothetical protein
MKSAKRSRTKHVWSCSPQTILFLPLSSAFFLAGWSFCSSNILVFSSFEGRNSNSPHLSSSSSQVRSSPAAKDQSATWKVDQNNSPGETWTSETTEHSAALMARGPLDELQSFLQNQGKHTPAARFVELLRTELHGQPQWEAHRYWACRQKKWGLCIGGFHNAPNATSSSTDVDEMQAYLPLLPPTDNTTVFRIQRFRGTEKTILVLGTHMACLPLFLAGASMDVRNGMVVELGPFAGFSSKCLAHGVLAAFRRAEEQELLEKNSAMNMAPRLVSMDTFSGQDNYNTMARRKTWILKAFPDLNKTNTDFLELWQQTVQYVYPKAIGAPGNIDRTTLSDHKLKSDFGVSSIHVLMADSIKTPKSFHSQLEGVTVEAGTVLFLMDILISSSLQYQVWSCLRQDYLLPVYISWWHEHMAFVVTKTFSINQQSDIYQCYVDTAADLANRTSVMKARIKQDLTYLAGLTSDPTVHGLYNPEPLNSMIFKLTETMDAKAEISSRDLAKMGRDFLATMNSHKA